jgi:hypothetical protein
VASAPDAPLSDTAERDQQALDLRVAGRSFAGIASELGYERTVDVVTAFNRALRRKSKTERDAICRDETVRLDALAAKITAEGDEGPERVRRLQTVDRLRARLLAP